MTTTYDVTALPGLVGTELGVSAWTTIDQDRIQRFASATGDEQWLHTDPARAARGPFGRTVAHGLLTLSLLPALAARGIRIVDTRELADRQLALGAYFRDSVLPVLTPLAIDESRPFPLLASLSLNIALRLEPTTESGRVRLAIVQVPAGLPRLIPLTDMAGYAFVLLEEVIREHLPQLFPGHRLLECAAGERMRLYDLHTL